MTRLPAEQNERGFVLVVVLWFIALLTIFAATFSLSAQGGIKLVEAEINTVKQRSYLDAGIELAAYHTSISPPQDRWQADGRLYKKSIGKTILNIRLYDQSGRIDINKADPQILLGLLRQFVHDPNNARRLKEVIASGRKKNTAHKISEPASRRKTALQPPRDNLTSKYIDISQLQYEPGMTRKIYQNIFPFITVHSKDGRINPLTAPRRVLMSIPTINQFAIDRFIEARRLEPMDKNLVKRLPSSAQKWITKIVGPAIKVVVDINVPPRHRSQFVSAIILPSIDREAPFRTLRRHFVFAPPELRGGPL